MSLKKCGVTENLLEGSFTWKGDSKTFSSGPNNNFLGIGHSQSYKQWAKALSMGIINSAEILGLI